MWGGRLGAMVMVAVVAMLLTSSLERMYHLRPIRLRVMVGALKGMEVNEFAAADAEDAEGAVLVVLAAGGLVALPPLNVI